jgi:tetrahydromethanopterin S-methyltransferase subunit A
MLKVSPAEGYPPEEGRYVRGNDYSPVAVCVILDTFDFAIPKELNELVMAGVDSGAALSGMLQTENIGIEKIVCNIVANPNIRYLVLCGRESAGHLPGEALLMLKQNGIDETRRIVGSTALTPFLSNIPAELVQRFNIQIVTIINLLCKPGETDLQAPGLNSKTIEQAVRACYQEEPTQFMGYTVYDIGAYPEPPIYHRIATKLEQPQAHPEATQPGKAKMGLGLMLHKFLPQTDCRRCGKRTCLAFAIDLAKGKVGLDDCPYLSEPEFAENRRALKKLLDLE